MHTCSRTSHGIIRKAPNCRIRQNISVHCREPAPVEQTTTTEQDYDYFISSKSTYSPSSSANSLRRSLAVRSFFSVRSFALPETVEREVPEPLFTRPKPNQERILDRREKNKEKTKNTTKSATKNSNMKNVAI